MAEKIQAAPAENRAGSTVGPPNRKMEHLSEERRSEGQFRANARILIHGEHSRNQRRNIPRRISELREDRGRTRHALPQTPSARLGGSNVAQPLCFLLIGVPTRKLSIQELFGGLCAATPEHSVATQPFHDPRTLSHLGDLRPALSFQRTLEYLVTSLPALRLCGFCAFTTAVGILGHCVFSAERFLSSSGSSPESISSLRYRGSIGRHSASSPTVFTRLRLVIPHEDMIFGPRLARVGVGSVLHTASQPRASSPCFPFSIRKEALLSRSVAESFFGGVARSNEKPLSPSQTAENGSREASVVETPPLAPLKSGGIRLGAVCTGGRDFGRGARGSPAVSGAVGVTPLNCKVLNQPI